MGTFNDILKKAQKILSCPICKRAYNLNEIKLKGMFENIYIFQTLCSNGHAPVITIFIANYNKKNNKKLAIVDESTNVMSSITSDEIKEMHNCLNNFDGDFQKIFSK